MSLSDRILKGEAAIAAAKSEGRDVREWEEHLARLKCEATLEDLPPRAWIVEEVKHADGNLRAAMICSAPLEAHVWLIFDADFDPRDGLALFFADELPALRTKTIEQLREIHKVKLVFPRSRVIQ